MTRSRRTRIPSYRLHKPSDSAVVSIDGNDFYVGAWNSSHSKREYDRLITEWLAGGRSLTTGGSHRSVTITELVAEYWCFAERYYTRDGKPTAEQNGIRGALRPLRRLYGAHECSDFGPLALKAVRQTFIDGGKSRRYINDCVGRIKRLFKWGVENELVAAEVLQGLQAVAGLRSGRSAARETDPICPVADDVIEATCRQVTPVVAVMIQLQRYTGMRLGELVIMRGCDLDVSGAV